jgi:hypothetical protein
MNYEITDRHVPPPKLSSPVVESIMSRALDSGLSSNEEAVETTLLCNMCGGPVTVQQSPTRLRHVAA